jgi:hypothetical protein
MSQKPPFPPWAYPLTASALFDQYEKWKTQNTPTDPNQYIVPVTDPLAPTDAEIDSLRQLINATNMAIYQGSLSTDPVATANTIMARLGAIRIDVNPEADDQGVTSLTIRETGEFDGPFEYIPYTDRGIAWHTDGYYNDPDHVVRAITLYCVRQSPSGGENDLLDHELLYFALRAMDPALVAPLFRHDALTIPPRIENGVTIRETITGPVFSVDPTGALHMRYTHRIKSVKWSPDPLVQQARKTLRALLETPLGIVTLKLPPGAGLVCNNVLHTRRPFIRSHTKQSERLLLRIRYYDSL